LIVGLQQHAKHWVRPDGFVRPRVDALTSPAKAASISSSAAAPPLQDRAADHDACVALVDELLDTAATATVQRALPIAATTLATLEAHAGGSQLIHGDLHYENFLFRDGVACAIDFDDCGWGPPLYDLAVTLWELEGRDRYPAMRDALLDEFAQHLPLPAGYATHLRALFVLRRLQMLMWILESRGHVAFRDHWREWALDEVAGIAGAVRRV
jgi:Ser/Thr protein kinase RdoA (MazF antagonist)